MCRVNSFRHNLRLLEDTDSMPIMPSGMKDGNEGLQMLVCRTGMSFFAYFRSPSRQSRGKCKWLIALEGEHATRICLKNASYPSLPVFDQRFIEIFLFCKPIFFCLFNTPPFIFRASIILRDFISDCKMKIQH